MYVIFIINHIHHLINSSVIRYIINYALFLLKKQSHSVIHHH